ncbi:hypothetical protein M9458_041244, partial [Cirrhinus mrigala]
MFSDGKWTNITGTQLSPGQPETNIPSGEPGSVATLVCGRICTTGICLNLIWICAETNNQMQGLQKALLSREKVVADTQAYTGTG